MSKCLEERMDEEVDKCTKWGTYQNGGKEKRGGNCMYCTYFYPSNQKEPLLCSFLGSRVEIRCGDSKDPLFRHYVSFYKCNRSSKYKPF
ncbi:hypothetical protein HOC13_03990 [Candidatus Woesearchaeota archaeon]|nr:hypothetical protein [Candidatus Woesearchaeota archaeon]